MKRIIASLLLVCALLTIVPVAAFASPAEAVPTAEQRAEELIWYYREYNGKTQKRLWSVSQGMWLTDWIDC